MFPLDDLIQPIWEIAPYPIAVVSFDSDPAKRTFVYVNPAFTKLTGYDSTEIVGLPATLLDGPKTAKAAIHEYETAVAQGKASKTAIIHYRKDGSEYVTDMVIAPLVEPDGSSAYLVMSETILASANPAAATYGTSIPGVVVPLYLPMPLKEFPDGRLPHHLVSHQELDDLQTLWIDRRGDRRLPLRSDFDLQAVSRWAPHLTLASVLNNGRFQFRLFGTELAKVYGQDLTGRFLDELAPRDLWSIILLHYDEVVRTKLPLFAPISIANGRWYTEVSRLLLPLATKENDDTVSLIMGADYTRF